MLGGTAQDLNSENIVLVHEIKDWRHVYKLNCKQLFITPPKSSANKMQLAAIQLR